MAATISCDLCVLNFYIMAGFFPSSSSRDFFRNRPERLIQQTQEPGVSTQREKHQIIMHLKVCLHREFYSLIMLAGDWERQEVGRARN